MISWEQYGDLLELTQGFMMSPNFARENISKWPNLAGIRFEILEFYIVMRKSLTQEIPIDQLAT